MNFPIDESRPFTFTHLFPSPFCSCRVHFVMSCGPASLTFMSSLLASLIFLFHPAHTTNESTSNIEDLRALLSLTAGVVPRDASWSAETPPCRWVGVTCGSNASHVAEINFMDMALSGTVNLTLLPPSLVQLRLSNAMMKPPRHSSYLHLEGSTGFTGIPDFSNFPPTLSYVDLSGNKFEGRVGLSPSCCLGLREVFLHYNHFAAIDLTALPPSLQVLTLFGNKLRSDRIGLELAYLPPQMVQLDLAWNAGGLTGPVTLTSLPSTLEVLNLYGNNFSGQVRFENLPPALKWLALDDDGSRFCGGGRVSPANVCGAIYAGRSCHVNCTTSTYSCGSC